MHPKIGGQPAYTKTYNQPQHNAGVDAAIEQGVNRRLRARRQLAGQVERNSGVRGQRIVSAAERIENALVANKGSPRR